MIPLHSLFEFDVDDVGSVVKKLVPTNIEQNKIFKPKVSSDLGFMNKYRSGIKQGFKSGQYYGTKDTMNRINTDDKLRGQITRQHIGKQVGDAANKASQFATKNAKTIGLVGAGAAGAGLLNRRRR